ARDPLPMIRPRGPLLAAELQRRHEEHGVRLHLSTGVARFAGSRDGRGRVTGVALTDGSVLPADVVVEALGSIPSVDWLDGHGFDLTDGVLTDAALRPVATPSSDHATPADHANRVDHADPPDGAAPRGAADAADRVESVDGVAVVGDISRFPNPRFGPGAWRVEHWSVPTDTGRRAGAVLAAFLAGDAERYASATSTPWEILPSFWSDQYDLRLQSYGMPGLAGPDGVKVLEGDLDADCVVGYHRDSQLVGVVGIGMLPRVNSYREHIRYTPT
ncbi:MAG: FAD-dependent oxidoreductase, partial [Kineosporiaceae bacterium]